MADPVTNQLNQVLTHDAHWTPQQVTPPHEDLKLSGAKDGVDYDNCPDCGERDVEPMHKVGGRDSKGEEYWLNSTYHCGCGANWCRCGPQDAQRSAYSGQRQSQAGLVGRVISIPSERYKANYSRIDWSK